MEIDVKHTDRTIVYLLKGEIEKQTLIELKEIITESISSGETRDIEVDMSKVTQLDSLNLGEFMKIKNSIQNKNIKFKLINPSERVKFLIEISSMEPFLLDDENY